MNSNDHDQFHMPSSYVDRTDNDYYDVRSFANKIIVHQPEIYFAADFILRQTGRKILVDIGSGNGNKLATIGGSAKLKYAIDFGVNAEYFKKHYPECTTFDLNLESANLTQLPNIDWSGAVVICADVIEHLRSPFGLMDCLKYIFDSGGGNCSVHSGSRETTRVYA